MPSTKLWAKLRLLGNKTLQRIVVLFVVMNFYALQTVHCRNHSPPTVAVIGCGPSGMFFLHALATRRTKLEEQGDAEGLADLPVVTCLERSPWPGGVWCSDGPGVENNRSTIMYDNLWINGPKETMEFFDHTYLEHFGRAMPAFLPRGLVLEYILTRCTKNNPSFFDDVKFNTSVVSVKHDAETEKFVVRLSEGTESSFDVCIWAAGANGKPMIPSSIHSVLTLGGFKGTIMHSSESNSNFEQHVRDNYVVMIGDNLSAEDLTLQAIKLGVESVGIVSRSAHGISSSVGSWPLDLVDLHGGYIPTSVTDDGYGIVLSKVEYNFDLEKYDVDLGNHVTLEDVDTVIFCTGYEPNFDMLDENLRPDWDLSFSKSDISHEAWKMSKNLLTEDLGDIPLDNEIWPDFNLVRPDLYRGRLISNPSMFFMLEVSNAHPLFTLDIMAWLVLAQITGDLPIPPPEQIHQFNSETILAYLNDPFHRYNHDDNYAKGYKKLNLDKDHWTNDYTTSPMKELSRNSYALEYRLLARDATDAGYPLDFGTYSVLNDKGEKLASMDMVSAVDRYRLDYYSPDSSWRTFRDVDPSKYISIFTDTKAVPLKRRWLELDSCEKDDIVDQTAGNCEESSPLVPLTGELADGRGSLHSGHDKLKVMVTCNTCHDDIAVTTGTDGDDVSDYHPSLPPYMNIDHTSAEQPIPNEATFGFLRETFLQVKTDLSNDPSDVKYAESILTVGNGFNVLVQAKHSTGKGRGVFATHRIPKGTIVMKEDDSQSRYFFNEVEWKTFLSRLPRDLACDCVMWAWVCDYGDGRGHAVGLDFGVGALMNHGSHSVGDMEENNLIYPDKPRSWNLIAKRDIERGEELLSDYGDFHEDDHKLHWYTDSFNYYCSE